MREHVKMKLIRGVSVERIKNRQRANARRRPGINAALPRYNGTMITIIYVYGHAGVCRLLSPRPNLRPLVPVVSADLQRFTARQDLAKLSRFPVLPTNVAFHPTK